MHDDGTHSPPDGGPLAGFSADAFVVELDALAERRREDHRIMTGAYRVARELHRAGRLPADALDRVHSITSLTARRLAAIERAYRSAESTGELDPDVHERFDPPAR